MSTRTPASQQAAAGWSLLSPRAPLAHRRGGCTHARMRASPCSRCAAACPTGALAVVDQGPVLAGECTGCGRCQAACPAGALAVPGFDVLAIACTPDTATVTVDCVRALPAAGQLRVPCLGGLDEAALAALCVRFPRHALVLADRGACGTCDSGGNGPHPAAATLLRATGWLAEAGVPPDRLPRLEQRPGSRCAADPMQSGGRSRRGFFSALAAPRRTAALPLPTGAGSRRRALLQALAVLAARHGGRVAPSLFVRIEIGRDCTGGRACATACPTRALVRYRDEASHRAGVAFEAADCVGCGACADACGTGALRLHPAEHEPAPGLRPLTRFAERECAQCSARFVVPADGAATLCERCRRSAELARAAFHTLFADRPRPRPDPLEETP